LLPTVIIEGKRENKTGFMIAEDDLKVQVWQDFFSYGSNLKIIFQRGQHLSKLVTISARQFFFAFFMLLDKSEKVLYYTMLLERQVCYSLKSKQIF